MKKSTVERLFSAKVAELLNDGWHINTGTICFTVGFILMMALDIAFG